MASPEVVADDCFLIRDALALEDQVALAEHIASRDRTPTDAPRAMVPAPRTLVLGDDGASPTVRYQRGDGSIVCRIVDDGISELRRAGLTKMDVPGGDLGGYSSLSMATIRYEAGPGGRFPPHVDHCKDSAVFLISLGRTANFTVRGRGQVDARRLKLRSGDVLVFDASTEAGVLHGVEGIDGSASEAGGALAEVFPVFGDHRYGVQCRMYF